MAKVDVDGIKVPRRVSVGEVRLNLTTRILTVPYEVEAEDGTVITRGLTTEDLSAWNKLKNGLTLDELSDRAAQAAKNAAKKKYG